LVISAALAARAAAARFAAAMRSALVMLRNLPLVSMLKPAVEFAVNQQIEKFLKQYLFEPAH